MPAEESKQPAFGGELKIHSVAVVPQIPSSIYQMACCRTSLNAKQALPGNSDTSTLFVFYFFLVDLFIYWYPKRIIWGKEDVC